LTENKNDVRKIEDLVFWDNPRKYIWMAEVRKVFTDLQKKWYSDENAIKFFTNKNLLHISMYIHMMFFLFHYNKQIYDNVYNQKFFQLL